MTDDNLRSYLEILITPQNDEEMNAFRVHSLVDNYVSIKNRIPEMTRSELIYEINIQLEPYNLKIDEN